MGCRKFSISALAAFLICIVARDGLAGAFMSPEGQGQIITGVGYIAASRTFDKSGRSVPAPSFRKAEIGAYLEYGLTNWLTLVAAPTIATIHAGGADNAYSGSDSSALGARLMLLGTETGIVAIQALVQPPVGPRRAFATEAALGGPNASATDLRIQFGKAFDIGSWPSFVDIEPGARLRGGGWPNEARLDLAFGLRPVASSLILLQSFISLAPRGGQTMPSSRYAKLQLSLVHDISRAWSLQFGGVGTIAGRNATREFGPLVAVWYRF